MLTAVLALTSPELTLAAYEGAVAQGADGFECRCPADKR